MRDRELDLVRAWHTAALSASASVGKLPSLKSLLERVQPPVKQDVKTLRHMAVLIADTYGLKLRKRKSMKAKS